MTRILLLVLLLLLPAIASAQIGGPQESTLPDVTPDGAENWLQNVNDEVDKVIDRDDLAEVGMLLFAAFLFFRLIALTRIKEQDLFAEELSDILVTVLTVSLIMGYYSTPLPGMTINLHQVPSFMAKIISGVFDTAVVKDLFQRFGNVSLMLQHPSWYDGSALFVYFIVEVLMLAMDAVLFVITSWGFVGHGFCVVYGRLFVPFLMTKRSKGKFWSWLDWLISFAMYRAVGATMISIWGGVVIRFFNNTAHKNYALTHWTVIAAALVIVSLGFIYGLIKVPWLTEKFFGGMGHAAEGFGMAAMAGMSKLVMARVA